jgi:hypothetical protein
MYGFAISLYNTTRWLYSQGSSLFVFRVTENTDARITENNDKLIIE